MFSLIITIISIALVAVLALATLYYGGDAFNKGTADAQAAKIVNQGQQLLAAAELFRSDAANAGVPMTMAELIGRGYLKSVPVAYQGNGSVAEAWAAAAWSMPVDDQPVFVADVDATGACKAVNKRTIGLDGILAQAHDSIITQCYGANADSLKAVVGKNAAAFASIVAAPAQTVLPAADITSNAIPAWDASSGWLGGQEPTVAAAGSSGGTPSTTEYHYTLTIDEQLNIAGTALTAIPGNLRNFSYMVTGSATPSAIGSWSLNTDYGGARTWDAANGVGAVTLTTLSGLPGATSFMFSLQVDDTAAGSSVYVDIPPVAPGAAAYEFCLTSTEPAVSNSVTVAPGACP